MNSRRAGKTCSVCTGGTCVVDCDTLGDPAIDDGLCAGVDASLTCSESAGDLCVIGPNDFIRNLMKILNIDEYVGIYNSEESFRSFLNLPPA